MDPLRFTKESWEQKQLEFTITPALATNDVFESVQVFMVDSDGNDVSSSMIEGMPTYLDGKIYVIIKGGTSGEWYTLVIYITTQLIPEKIKDKLRIRVQDTVTDVAGVV